MILILYAMLVYNLSWACSCVNIPKGFVTNIQEEHVIIHAKVLSHNAAKPTSFNIKSYTYLERIKVLAGKTDADTLLFVNGEGASCGASIAGIPVGEEIIVKSVQIDDLELAYLFPPDQTDSKRGANKVLFDFAEKGLLLKYEICDQWLLKVEENKAHGNITRSFQQRHVKIFRFIESINYDWGTWYINEYKPWRRKQHFSLPKTYRKITRKSKRFLS